MKRLLSFLAAGSIGFAVDAGSTLLLLHLAGPFLARAVGIAAALSFAWVFHRSLRFGRSARMQVQGGFRHATVTLVSAAVNYAVYVCLLLSTPILQPLVALTLASVCGLLLGLFGRSRFVFRHHRR